MQPPNKTSDMSEEKSVRDQKDNVIRPHRLSSSIFSMSLGSVLKDFAQNQRPIAISPSPNPLVADSGYNRNIRSTNSSAVVGSGPYNFVWWILYVLNFLAYFCLLFFVDGITDGIESNPTIWVLVVLSLFGLISSMLITDIVTDFVCILIAMALPHKDVSPLQVSHEPMTPHRANKYLVVYCLKSNSLTDIEETLRYLGASWRVNCDYDNASYLILSGTQNQALARAEREAVDAWNFNKQQDGIKCFYLRRTRTVLHKYGQYLDLLTLLNGTKKPAYYKDCPSVHESGDVFDPTTDGDSFCGKPFEFLVIQDKDNILSHDFFDVANRYFEAFPLVEIIQPTIAPYPEEFRTAMPRGETYYSRLNARLQAMGNALSDYKQLIIPAGAFWGKGIIRRSAYNRTLLEWDASTMTSYAERNIPKDLLSHDIIESCVMSTLKAPELVVYEGLPWTHAEWAIRQQRWDTGDLTIAKYLYPFSFGLLPNILSRFSYGHVRHFYAQFFELMAGAIYTSTYNVRCIIIKPLIVASMAVFFFSDASADRVKLLAVIINAQIVLFPFLVGVVAVKGSFGEKLLLQAYLVYFGAVDIYFGCFRMLSACLKIVSGERTWRAFKQLGTSPFLTTLSFCRHTILELTIAIAALAILVALRHQDFGPQEISFAVYLIVVITFPLFVWATAQEPKVVDTAASRRKRIGESQAVMAAFAEIAQNTPLSSPVPPMTRSKVYPRSPSVSSQSRY